MANPFTVLVAIVMLLIPLVVMLLLEVNGQPTPSHTKWKAAFHGMTPR